MAKRSSPGLTDVEPADEPLAVSRLGLWPRLFLAVLPVGAALLADPLFSRCSGLIDLWVCIYFFDPLVMGATFAILVLGPCIRVRRHLLMRLVGLVLASAVVHMLVVDLTIGWRGVIDIPGLKSIFLNVIPLAVVASVLLGCVTAVSGGRRISSKLVGYTAAAGLVAGSLFVIIDEVDHRFADLLPAFFSDVYWPWGVWHVAMAGALFAAFVTAAASRDRRQTGSGFARSRRGL